METPKKRKKISSRGGAREGAGRPRRTNGREVIPFRLNRELIKVLKAKAHQSGLRVSVYVERLVENHLKFESEPEKALRKKKAKTPPEGT
jgi:hypothetical protein